MVISVVVEVTAVTYTVDVDNETTMVNSKRSAVYETYADQQA